MKWPILVLSSAVLLLGACQSHVINGADQQVYRLIEDRQRATLGNTSDAYIGPETGRLSGGERMYTFAPRPVESGLAELFQPAEQASAVDEVSGETAAGKDEPDPGAVVERTPDIFPPEMLSQVETPGLREVLAYAMRHGRDLQYAKEKLYLQALALALERHEWTPRLSAVLGADAESRDAGGVVDDTGESDNERTMIATSGVEVAQKLPYGATITAKLANELGRDLERHAILGETGTLSLEATIPLLSGAGRAAYEMRYQAERSLTYAVREYERYRRSYVVQVAGQYFELQQSKARIANAFKSYLRRKNDWEKADFINRMGQSQTVFEAPRARASFRSAEASLVSAKEQYQTALDRFKISIGMPVDVLLDAVSQEDDIEAGALDRLLTAVDEVTAIDVALHHRLDLLTAADQVDDSRRAVAVTKNGLLPGLQFTAGAYLDSDPERSNSTTYNLEQATYQAGLALEMDDRKAERTAYRQALITLRRAERAYGETVDGVRADVREALRDIDKQENLRAIQALNVQENEVRYEAASAQYDLGRSTNQDVVDADTDLLAARNELARAVADYRNSILRFRLATGTLRVTDDGTWDDLAAYLPGASTTVAPGP